jgi:hypothetical protein
VPGSSRLRSRLQALLLVVGLTIVGYFVWRTGPEQVLAALEAAGRFVPLLALFELLVVLTDVAAFAALLGEDRKAVSRRGWVRSSALSYGCLILLPAGRTASEAARASVVARYVGGMRAATAGAQLQASALAATGFMSGVAALVVFAFVDPARGLGGMLAGNSAFVAASGVLLLVLVRHRGLARRLAQRFPKIFTRFAAGEGRPHTLGVVAVAWSFLGRVLQLVQFAVAVLAVGGSFSLIRGAVAFGIHLVMSTVGVAIPNQVGVADGAYVLFAEPLGFGATPARALAVMLAVRATQIPLALACFLIPALLRERAEETGGPDPAGPAP